jgi:hypothetical protein
MAGSYCNFENGKGGASRIRSFYVQHSNGQSKARELIDKKVFNMEQLSQMVPIEVQASGTESNVGSTLKGLFLGSEGPYRIRGHRFHIVKNGDNVPSM